MIGDRGACAGEPDFDCQAITSRVVKGPKELLYCTLSLALEAIPEGGLARRVPSLVPDSQTPSIQTNIHAMLGGFLDSQTHCQSETRASPRPRTLQWFVRVKHGTCMVSVRYCIRLTFFNTWRASIYLKVEAQSKGEVEGEVPFRRTTRTTRTRIATSNLSTVSIPKRPSGPKRQPHSLEKVE